MNKSHFVDDIDYIIGEVDDNDIHYNLIFIEHSRGFNVQVNIETPRDNYVISVSVETIVIEGYKLEHDGALWEGQDWYKRETRDENTIQLIIDDLQLCYKIAQNVQRKLIKKG